MSIDFLPFALPDLGDAEIDAVVGVLRSKWITTGPKVKEFEERFSTAVNAPHVVMVNSCTAALHLALEALGISAGDEVIVPTITFTATAEVVRYFGAIPVFADVREDDHNIDVNSIERAITARTKAIIPVHFAGMAADMDEIVSLARTVGCWVVDDAAHAFPCSYRGRKVGTLADITAFSFYATKTITTGEGGAAVTANEEWASRMRKMALHGISKDAWKRYTAQGSWYYEVEAPGFKYNMTDIAAALGIVQLSRADEMRSRRQLIAEAYDKAFKHEPAIELLERKADRSHSYHLYIIKLRPGCLTIDRAQFIEELKNRGIGASVHFIPLHEQPYYRDTFKYAPTDLPIAHDVAARSISLPIYSSMTDFDVAKVIQAVTDICLAYRR